jgi:hypothetical protein
MTVYKRPNPPRNEFILPSTVEYGIVDVWLAEEGPSSVRYAVLTRVGNSVEVLCECEAHFHGSKASDVLKAVEEHINANRKRIELLKNLKFQVHECE